jgi:hypothetical protein
VDNAFAAIVRWLNTHDRGYVALRRAGRAAIVMPAIFAFSLKVIDNQTVALFAAFGAIAQLMLVGFTGEMRSRLEAQASLAVAGAVMVTLATLCSREVWLAALSMAAQAARSQRRNWASPSGSTMMAANVLPQYFRLPSKAS